MKNLFIIFCILTFLSGCAATERFSYTEFEDAHPLVISARKQIGKVIYYDTSYYSGGYPPTDRGACTDVIEQGLRDNDYDLKTKIDQDMKNNPERYPHESDPNINFRRVRNVKIFLDYYAEKLPTELDEKNLSAWKSGNIVTFDQIPGSLWHIAIISNKKNQDNIPLLIHNYGRGVVEDDYLLTWPAPITGHYKIY